MYSVFSLRICEYFAAFLKEYDVSGINGTLTSPYHFYLCTILTTEICGRHVILTKQRELLGPHNKLQGSSN